MFKDKKDNTQENGMYVNRYICANETLVNTSKPYDCDRTLKAIVEPIKDDTGYEMGFTITEIVPSPRIRNKQVYKGPHLTLRICKDGSFRGSLRFDADTAKSPASLKREISHALGAIQSYVENR